MANIRKPVVGFVDNYFNDEFFIRFDSTTAAAKFIGLRSPSDISKVCRGKATSAGKWNGRPVIWEYVSKTK